ncbi:hypothetical protein SAMN05446635_6836 [Burkholderia sp. OK233]|nr:hypothetical protein SAMN05446635_6836 [Burkholderia sp. OK233]
MRSIYQNILKRKLMTCESQPLGLCFSVTRHRLLNRVAKVVARIRREFRQTGGGGFYSVLEFSYKPQ